MHCALVPERKFRLPTGGCTLLPRLPTGLVAMAQAMTHTQSDLALAKQLAEGLPEGQPLRLKFESRSAAFFGA